MVYVYKLLVSNDTGIYQPVLARCIHLEGTKLNKQSDDVVDAFGLYIESMWELNDKLEMIPTDATSGSVLVKHQHKLPYKLTLGHAEVLPSSSYHGFHAFSNLDNKPLLASYLKYFQSMCSTLNATQQS